MGLSELKYFLKNHNIELYDEQYRILDALLKKYKNVDYMIGGGSIDSYYEDILGSSRNEINFKIKYILKKID